MMKKVIIIISIIIIVVISFIIFVLSRYFGEFIIEEGKNINLNDMNFVNEFHNEKLTHIRLVSEESEDSDRKAEIIYTFKDNKCISERVKFIFKDEKLANEQYEKWNEIDMVNLVINKNEVCFNSDGNIGKTKEEILENKSLEYVEY